jgi:glycosyltransferase involved in cell wall biosynthesis
MSETSCKKQNIPLRILLIGPLPPPIGGIGVSFKILIELLRRRDDLNIKVVDFNAIRRRKGNSLRGFLSLCSAVISKAMQVDVITVYFASTALPSLGLLLLVISRIIGKPLVVRKAAGFDYLDLGFFKGRIADFIVKHTDLYLAQTKHLVRLAHDRGISHVRWYPTNRPMGGYEYVSLVENRSCRRFVSIGQVREYKGIREIIQAAERFEEGISVDIYGPLFDDLEHNIFEKCKRVNYCGILSSEDVIPTLKRYDMLLLPTKAVTEGYPGAVFEGYSAGLPIITTRCGGIPEIVDDRSGIFVEPGNSDALFEAMKTVVEGYEVYRKLRQGVYEKRKEFDAAIWADCFVEYCREVVEKP